MIDDLEARGYVGPADGSKGRKVTTYLVAREKRCRTSQTPRLKDKSKQEDKKEKWQKES